jgi:flagellar hook protein FlgE
MDVDLPDPTGSGTPPTVSLLAAHLLSFDASGKLMPPLTPISLTIPVGTFDTTGTMPTPAQNVTLNLADSRGNPLFTSAASKSGTSYTDQNGYASSVLEKIQFDPEGRVIGIAVNGNSITLAQLALATFPNDEGLQKYNGSTFIASMNAGEPSIGVADSGGRGKVQGGMLEMSNVDMAEEFVNLVIGQRAYQANCRMITTSDELYMEAINLKR